MTIRMFCFVLIRLVVALCCCLLLYRFVVYVDGGGGGRIRGFLNVVWNRDDLFCS